MNSIYYSDYLKLDEILNAQSLESEKMGKKAHDEHLFIVIHQAYELWFKQILVELDSAIELFKEPELDPRSLSLICHRMNRVIEIQKVLIDQMRIIETMTSLDFMEFRDFLTPASGFQSLQFRQLEIKLGFKEEYRMDMEKKFFNSRLKDKDKNVLRVTESQKTLLELVEAWLERMPFAETKNFSFWKSYQQVVEKMLNDDAIIIKNNSTLKDVQKEMELKNLAATRENFHGLFNEEIYNKNKTDGLHRISRKAKLAAIFIQLNRSEPILQTPFNFLMQLVDIDEHLTTWRYRHAIMAGRILGTKIGTGGSSGHEYLKKTTEHNKVFPDFFNIATYLIPKSRIPDLPSNLKDRLSFKYYD